MVDFEKHELVKQGAEARLYAGQFLGQQVIIKQRFSKAYRHPDLDATLTKERHRAECRALVKCHSLGVPVPTMYLCDNETSTIVMDRLSDAETARDLINKCLKENDSKKLEEMAVSIGELVAKLHCGGLIHGDITTSNIMVNKCGKLYFIDFGLSFQEGTPEDKGVDLYVLERALISTHPNTEYVFQAILDAYTKASANQGKEVIKKFEEIRMRGRKRTMVG
jgi:TP53 regulating kinase-like protein